MKVLQQICNFKIGLVLLGFVLRSTLGQGKGREEKCATLYQGVDFLGEKYEMKDGSIVANFDEEHISSTTVLNSTLSIEVEKGCEFKGHNMSYFEGTGMDVRDNLSTIPSGFGSFLSGSCHCLNDKVCSCEDIWMKRSSCGRAYLYPGGCNICNRTYTDLKERSNPSLAVDFQDKITAIRLREGCSISLFASEDYDGDALEISTNTDDYQGGVVKSYECVCEEDSYVPRPKGLRPETYPELLDIPDTLDGVYGLMKGTFTRHPGLMAAVSSLKNKRSSRNVYILTMGSTGSGKSTAMNLLFDNPEVTKTGGTKSTTTDIHEFRIPIPVDELGIGNSELRIIDTPGLGDTRGLNQDALFLATLDEYLSTHEELKHRIPNVVLIFHKFHDNRFEGEAAKFVQMLRGLDTFRDRITDQDYSNVLFVFSHFCSETKSMQKNPNKRLQQFKSVIEEYSQFPKPTVLVVAENKAEDQFLPMINGYFKLPNGELYPKNLFNKIQVLASSGGDEVGEAVIRTAFRDSEDLNITSVDYPLVSPNNIKVAGYLKILANSVFGVPDTEISQLLDEAHEKLDPVIQRKFPDALPYIQKALNIRNIRELADIPQTTHKTLELLSSLKLNNATIFLLDEGLGIKSPEYPYNIHAGYSFNVFEDRPLSISPFKLGDVSSSDIGYLFPSAVTCGVTNQQVDVFTILENREDYLAERIRSLGIEGRFPVDKFKGETKAGFNIRGVQMLNDSCTLTAVRELRTFQLVLNDRPPLTDEFKKKLKSLPTLNDTDEGNVQVWEEFFLQYGTHIINSIHGGGAIEIKLESSRACDEEIIKVLFNLIEFAEDLKLVTEAPNRTISQEGVEYSFQFLGGDRAYHSTDLTKLSIEEASTLMGNWKKSVKLNPVILKTEMGLYPISDVARRVGQNISTEIQRATALLFNSSLVWKRPQKNAYDPSRDDVKAAEDSSKDFNKLLELIMTQSNDATKRMEALMLQMSNDRKEADNARLAAEEKQRVWQQDQETKRAERERQDKIDREAREEKHKAELLKMQKESADKLLEWQKEQAREKAAADELHRKELIRIQEERDRAHQQFLQEEADRKAIADKKQRELQDRLRREEEARRKAEADAAAARRPSGGGGKCLKEGTPILMADWTEKAVQDLLVGDLVFDHQLRPSRVLGVSKEFFMVDNFNGFDNQSYFFTDGHLFAGPKTHPPFSEGRVQLYANNKGVLLADNPLMESLGVREMDEPFQIYKYDPTSRSVSPVTVEKVYTDRDSCLPPDTLVYFIQVDSPDGTYFANGYVCRHELPPVHHWPRTMAVLSSLITNPEFRSFEKVEHTMESISLIEKIVEEVGAKVLETLDEVNLEDLSLEKTEEMDLDMDQYDQIIQGIYGHPSFSKLGIGIYAATGKAMSLQLDINSQGGVVSGDHVGGLQQLLAKVISQQLTQSVEKYF